ncbi:hypothetical protein ABZ260_28835 [Streptosporangium sp. NPDC006013]|uniref:hypothetical protein n=1 Tax=Streptosporangium sp. NPDC006013 TaxID=3155596 RepID=UPI0033B9CCCA
MENAAEARADERARIVADLRRAAEGYRSYAAFIEEITDPSTPCDLSDSLPVVQAEAEMLENAAKVAEGDRRALARLIPPVLQTDEDIAALASSPEDAEVHRRIRDHAVQAQE